MFLQPLIFDNKKYYNDDMIKDIMTSPFIYHNLRVDPKYSNMIISGIRIKNKISILNSYLSKTCIPQESLYMPQKSIDILQGSLHIPQRIQTYIPNWQDKKGVVFALSDLINDDIINIINCIMKQLNIRNKSKYNLNCKFKIYFNNKRVRYNTIFNIYDYPDDYSFNEINFKHNPTILLKNLNDLLLLLINKKIDFDGIIEINNKYKNFIFHISDLKIYNHPYNPSNLNLYTKKLHRDIYFKFN